MTTPAFCTGSPDGDEITRRIFEGLTPTSPADYLALRRLEVTVPTRRKEDPGLVTLAERGTLCASATDRAACSRAYGRLESDAPWSSLVFFTRGDEVGLVRTQAQAIALLGTIDSPVKAFFVASQTGLRYSCQGPNATGYRATNGGFEIVTETGGCGKPVEQITVRVDAHGTTEEIGRITTQAQTEPCPQP